MTNDSPLISSDPWDNSPIAEFPIATPADITTAYSRARSALPPWSTNPTLRRTVITALAEVLKSRRTELATLISRETGKVLFEALLEADAMANKCAISIRAEDDRRTPTRKDIPGGTIATTYRPHGVTVVLGPFNFPGHLPLGHIIPALLAGNTVLFKPSEKTPATAALLADFFTSAGLPDNILQILQGGPDVATQLLDLPINAVFFTGSYNVGCKILARFTTRPGVLVALELGGNNPLIAWDIAPDNHPAAILNILQSAYATAGQRCSCARRLILKQNDPLLPKLITAIERLHIGHPRNDPHAFYGTLIDAPTAQQVLSAQSQLQAHPIIPVRQDPRSPALLLPGLLDVTNSTTQDDHEIFGPLLKLIHVPTFEAALAAANNTQYGLSSGLLTDNPALWETFRTTAEAGVLTLNRPTTGASSELPFGGTKNSGNHRPSAYLAADYTSSPTAEMTSPTLTLPPKLPPGITL